MRVSGLMLPSKNRFGSHWLVGVMLLAGNPLALAQSNTDISTQTKAARHSFAIPAQDLGSALSAFGSQTGIQVSYEARLTANTRTRGASGQLTEQEALARLFQGTGLSWTLTADRTLLLFRREEGSALNLAPSTVIANGIATETAEGPVMGYRATRSATGTKTDTPLRDIPQSIQIIPRQVIEDQQIINLGDALANVSSVQRGNSHGGSSESFVVRGFQSRTYAIDGMLMNPLVSRPEVTRDLANIERVEVLKGPASVLYGQGDPGGLINLVTRKPTFAPEAEVTAQAGSWDFYRLQTSASGPLDDAKTLAGRITVAGETKSGFRDTFQDNRRTYVAPSLRWQPSERTTVDVGMEYTDLTSQFDRGVIPQNGKIRMAPERFLHEPWSHDDADKLSAWFRIDHDVNEWLTLRQTTRWDDSYKERYVVDLRGLESDGRTLNRRVTDGDEEVTTLTSQFEAIATFDTAGIGHTFLVGYEYLKGDRNASSYRAALDPIDIYEPVYGATPSSPFEFSGISDYRLESHSVYLQDQIALNEQWKLLLGARYDSSQQENKSVDSDYVTTPTDLDPEEVSPRIGIVYQPTDWVSLYAGYSTSFVPQGDIDRNGRPLDPETGTQYEVGAKFDLIPDRLSATLAVFELTRENVAVPDPEDDEYSIQTGEQRVRGVELDVSGEPLDGWQLIGNVSVLDAKLTKDTEYEEGNRLQGVPTLSGSLWSSYQLQSGGLRGLGFGAGVFAAGQREGDIANSYDVSGYARVDASVFYDVNEQVRVSLNGRNLLDREYIETVQTTDGNYYGEPASVVATVSARF
ncbi:TonB-dependent siderophore receptor [Pseudomonas matsuisoli]|uniref:Metal-pseudopaline receptor CntO n=1 Tax=Pseudomonas matsuisoli TaxID=1515666 RepID=A0A917PN51_9PSED|nr:TonB-dependent receptor [Pseudomonas matsuisoli]GGJ84576.1 ligand-gated channel [Pseudomonas matsuisoli]